ncbi:TIGR00282 family metallophosphoesterase [Desulfovibrio inopinatus]|uniref:TIGR00282 family metallophosphoesterase n=1 Tax=Desulfovibrio inopinatus TaxID=102109 RepID=UPI0003FC83CA|nr:TIGR00282 family metallophosphoesterase [Desulfovibrio inopinatus]
MRICFFGDIVGRPGRTAIIERTSRLRREHAFDLVLANAENASGGLGLTSKSARQLLAAAGLDVLTSGNHIWKHKDLISFFQENDRVLRPANYPEGAPGAGLGIYQTESGMPYAIINLLGRTYMDAVDCPFQSAMSLLATVPGDVLVRLVDFHAEATSEKRAMGFVLDGRVTAVLGTHTHVQTNDAQILPQGTAYMTDLGMCGPKDSILGMSVDPIVQRFLTGRPHRFVVARNPARLEGCSLDVDDASGFARSIEAFVA